MEREQAGIIGTKKGSDDGIKWETTFSKGRIHQVRTRPCTCIVEILVTV